MAGKMQLRLEISVFDDKVEATVWDSSPGATKDKVLIRNNCIVNLLRRLGQEIIIFSGGAVREDDVMAIPVAKLNISPKTYAVLHAAKMYTCGDVMDRMREIPTLRNCGRKTIIDLDDALRDVGLSLNPRAMGDDFAAYSITRELERK